MITPKPGILILNDTSVFAGTEQYIFLLAGSLRNAGENVSIACLDDSPLALRLRAAGQAVVPVCPAPLNVHAYKVAAKLLREGAIQILHANNGRTAMFATLAVTLAGSGRIVMTQHFLEPCYVTRRGIKAKLSNIMHRWVDRRTDHLIAISEATSRGAIARGEAKPEGITVIPNGTAPPDRSALRAIRAVREELGFEQGIPLVVCAARLEPEKDVATLIEAMALVVRQFPTAVCVVAGEGRLRNELQERISGLGLERSVRLLGFRTDVMSIVNASDLFVLPSVAEPFGLVLVEAMSLGKPVVAIAAGGPLEIVEHGRTGLLVPPQNPQEMAAAIGQLLTSPETRDEMGSRGESKYRGEFTVERMTEQTIGVYRRVLAEPASHRADAVANSVSA